MGNTAVMVVVCKLGEAAGMFIVMIKVVPG